MSLLHGEVAQGYDFAREQIQLTTPQYLCDDYQALLSLSSDERVERLLEHTKTVQSEQFKLGIVKFVKQWWKLQESLTRTQPCFPSSNRLCIQCGCDQPFDDDAKTLHLDSHFRENSLLSVWRGDANHSKQVKMNKKSTMLVPHISKKQFVSSQKMLHLNLKDATRTRVLRELEPPPAKMILPATFTPIPQVSRGWMMPAKKWVSISITNVPKDVILYGNLQLANGHGFWITTFAKTLNNKISSHWQPWLCLNGLNNLSTNSLPSSTTTITSRAPYGSKQYMKDLASEMRTAMIRAENQFDDSRMCALCGDKFNVVLSEDPNDEFAEDFVLLDAVPHPIQKKSGAILHFNCFKEIARNREERKAKKKTQTDVSSDGKKRKTIKLDDPHCTPKRHAPSTKNSKHDIVHKLPTTKITPKHHTPPIKSKPQNFAHFQIEYKHELKERYLLVQLGKAFEKIHGNQKRCAYLTKKIHACNWGKNDSELSPEIVREFDFHIKSLNTQFNDHSMCAQEDWDSLQLCLKHLSMEDIKSVKQMLSLRS